MKNGLTIMLALLSFAFAHLGFSQEGDIDTRTDNWRYWLEKATLGVIPFNPDVRPEKAVQKGSETQAGGSMVNSPDIVIVTGTGISQSENSVFVNPTDNQISLNGNNSFGGTVTGANAMFTFDGGNTWTGGPNAPLSGNMGDPAAAIGLDGTSYMGHISAGFNQGIDISNNNGTTWTNSTVAIGSTLDKNHLWIDNSPASAFEGNLYSSWTTLGGASNGEIQIVRSTNNGTTWTTPLNISPAIAAGSHNQGVNIQTGPNGEVYAVWAVYDAWPARENALGFAVSTDGGNTFGAATRIHNNIRGIRWQPGFSGALANPHGKNMRTNSFPCMAVDISGGPNNGNIYVVWTNHGVPGVNTGTDISVYMMRSTNGGTTWSTPTRVNQDPIGNVQYFPWITCDPVTGDLSVIFYDDRDTGAAQAEAWVATSGDGGTTWTDFRVSDVAFTPAPIPGLAGGYMGDYLGIAARDGYVYPVWTDNRSGQTLAYTSPFTLGCPTNLTITADVLASGVDHREASSTITASNDVFATGEAVYHAGDEVLMTDGFTALNGSIYRAYIEGCTGNFVKSAPTGTDISYIRSEKPKMVEQFKSDNATIALTVFPNPTKDIFTVRFDNEEQVDHFRVKVFNMSKGLVIDTEFNEENTRDFQVDISEFPAGVYMIQLTDMDQNKVYTGQVIKN